MLPFAHAGLGLATLTLCAFSAAATPLVPGDPDPTWQSSSNVAELTEVLEDWLDLHTDFERRDAPPAITTITPSVGASLAGQAGREHGRTRGLYDPDISTIYLFQPWDPKDAQDASVLLHELVHHRQAPHHFVCPGAQEEAAYRLQDAWLSERGLQADVNWIAVVLESGCRRRDVHPD